MFLSVQFCCQGGLYTRSLNFCSHMIVWRPGKNTEGSIAAEEEGVPKVNI